MPLKVKKKFPTPGKAEAAAYAIVRALRQRGFESYTVGGAVRDRILGKTPREVDVATNATPASVQRIFPRTHAVGAAFGVVVVMMDDIPIEVATFREDREYVDGRHPSAVTFSDAEHDAQRRDFTINALMYDPVEHHVIDYVGGIDDLAGRVVRAIGDPQARFAEDYLRMLRAIRFSACFEFDIDPETQEAISALADRIVKISPERIFGELTKMLTGPYPDRAFRLMRDTGLLQQVLPEVSGLQGVQQPKDYHPEGDVWEHTMLLLHHLDHPTAELAWSALLHDVGKPATFQVRNDGRITFLSHAKVGAGMSDDILKRLRCSRDFTDRVRQMVYYHMQFMEVSNMRKSTLRRMLSRDTFEAELELHRLDCLACHRKLENFQFLVDKKKEFKHEPVMPKPFINGHDVMNYKIPQGPVIGKLLHELEELQLNGDINSRDEALRWLAERVDELQG